MLFNVNCSYGEIIDKLTILEIKLSKCLDKEKKRNIQNEYNHLCQHKKDENYFIELYTKLKYINMKLWECEDTIRLKSKNKEYDEEYILIAENIHKYNDKRYEIKSDINKKYNSFIIEEKFYNIKSTPIIE